MKSLDTKLGRIRDGSSRREDFILAHANDPDVALGVASVPLPEGGFKSRRAHQDAAAELVAAGAVDVMLTSVANGEQLALRGVFADSSVTLAIRANDTTDIWWPRGAGYAREPSRPFRTASLARVRPFCDLGLYSITLNNVLDRDWTTIDAYARFREEALRVGFRHFLEVFNPNAGAGLAPEAVPAFVNDSIVRVLSGVTAAERPAFLKVVYNGPRALEELVSHDPSLVVGILGGAAGTARDNFELLAQGVKHGARLALFGRKINLAESPQDMIALMWQVIRGELEPAEAVRAYHAALARKGLRPQRKVEEDARITEPVLQQG
jgi:hypothetical protein